jgi:hypothetical protein
MADIVLEWQRLRRIEKAMAKIKAIAARPGEYPGCGLALISGPIHERGLSTAEIISWWQEAFDNVGGKYVQIDAIQADLDRRFAWEAYTQSKISRTEFEEFYKTWKKGEVQ